jgi:putative DNA-binding protein (roi)
MRGLIMPNLQTFDKRVLTMTSRDIAELVESRHDDTKRSIERLAERGVIELPPLAEIPTATKPVQVYVFSGEQGKRDSIVVVAQLSPEFTARLVDRWQELEAQVAMPAVPQTLPEALRLAADIEEQRLVLAAKIEADAPKVAFAERHANADGWCSIRDAAKQSGIPERKFISLLLADGYVYRAQMSGRLIPYAATIKRGFMDVRAITTTRADGSEKALQQTMVLPKGLQHFQAKYGEVAA